jgi:hypothetical protein
VVLHGPPDASVASKIVLLDEESVLPQVGIALRAGAAAVIAPSPQMDAVLWTRLATRPPGPVRLEGEPQPGPSRPPIYIKREVLRPSGHGWPDGEPEGRVGPAAGEYHLQCSRPYRGPGRGRRDPTQGALRNATVDAGAGADAISFSLYGLDESYRGANTVVMKAGSGADYVYDFRSGTDHIDLTAFHFGITGQQVLDQAINVDNAGTADDYSYFYLTSAGGVDNYIVFMGLLSSQLQASDFIT